MSTVVPKQDQLIIIYASNARVGTGGSQKLFAASKNKLKRVTTVAKNGMESTGLKWNEKKCAVIHVKRGQVEQGSGDMKVADLKPVKCLDQHNTYKFLGVFENTK